MFRHRTIDHKEAVTKPARNTRHSLIFIRESEGQLTGSNCCGKLEGDWRFENGQPVFEKQRRVLTELAPLFLAVRKAFHDRIEILQVDPRNQFFLIPKIISQIWRHKRFTAASFRGLFMIYRLPAIILDGEVLFSGRIPTESELFSILPGEIMPQTDP